jgi:transmembrane sensor
MNSRNAAGARAAIDRGQEAIDAEACDWLVRLSDEDAGARDRDAFERWLAADPRHGETYDSLSRTWEDIRALRGLAALVDPAPRRPFWRRLPQAFAARPMRPAFAALVAAAAAAIFLLPPLFDRPDYATAIAEMRSVALPDGSHVTLGAHSQIDVAFSETRRRIILRNGEAFFDVARNPDRPFFVHAGDAVVRVVGTKFDVRRSDARVGVSVLEGVVQVSRSGDPALRTADARRVLRAGERLDMNRTRSPFDAAPALPAVERVRATPAGSWRQGRLSYDNAPLSELAADVNRYYRPGVRLASPDVGRLRITAAFRTDQIPAFMEALGAALPVDVERQADRSFSIRARAAGAQ